MENATQIAAALLSAYRAHQGGNTTKERNLAIVDYLRLRGIDVAKGSKGPDIVGRLPLAIHGHRGAATGSALGRLFVTSFAERTTAFLEKADKGAFPLKYFIVEDPDSDYATGANYSRSKCEGPIGEFRTECGLAVADIYHMEKDQCGRVVCDGKLFYNPEDQSTLFVQNVSGPYHEYAKKVSVTVEDDNPGYRSRFLTINFDGETFHDFYQPFDGTRVSVDDSLLRGFDFEVETTGASLYWRWGGLSLDVGGLPNKRFRAPFESRLIAKEVGDPYQHLDFDFSDTFDPEEVPEESMKQARAAIDYLLNKNQDSRRGYGSSYNIRHACAICLTPSPSPKEKRPVGHVVVGVTDGKHREYAVLCVCRMTARFEADDVYARAVNPATDEIVWARCNKRTMKSMKELFSGAMVLRDTLKNATNLKNKYACGAMADTSMHEATDEEGIGVSMIDSESMKEVAKLKFGHAFVEQAYRLGYIGLAREVTHKINHAHAWSRIDSLSDVVPGYLEDKGSIFLSFGMPKAWTKFAFQLAGKQDDCSLLSLREALCGVKLAWEYEGEVSKGKPSEASVPNAAAEVANLWSKACSIGYLSDGEGQVSNWLSEAYPNNVSGLIEGVRSFMRMMKKVASLGILDWGSRNYLIETFQAYCNLRSIGENPESLGVFYEYGLPENDRAEATAMIARRCGDAQAIVQGFQSRIDAKKRLALEESFKNERKSRRAYEYKSDDIRGYLFFLPTSIYGEDQPLSVEHEGKKQHHCLFDAYQTRLAHGEYAVVFMRHKNKPEAPVVTIGITKDGVVNQTYGYRDSQISVEQAYAINEWILRVTALGANLRMSGRPGGWNATIEPTRTA